MLGWRARIQMDRQHLTAPGLAGIDLEPFRQLTVPRSRGRTGSTNVILRGLAQPSPFHLSTPTFTSRPGSPMTPCYVPGQAPVRCGSTTWARLSTNTNPKHQRGEPSRSALCQKGLRSRRRATTSRWPQHEFVDKIVCLQSRRQAASVRPGSELQIFDRSPTRNSGVRHVHRTWWKSSAFASRRITCWVTNSLTSPEQGCGRAT